MLDAASRMVDATAWSTGVGVGNKGAFVKRAEVVMQGMVDDTVAVGWGFDEADFWLGDNFSAVGTGSVGTSAQLGLKHQQMAHQAIVKTGGLVALTLAFYCPLMGDE